MRGRQFHPHWIFLKELTQENDGLSGSLSIPSSIVIG